MVSLILAFILAQPPLPARVEWVPAQGAVLAWDGGDVLCVGRYSTAQPWQFLGCGASGFTDGAAHPGAVYTVSPSGGGDVLATIPLVSRAYVPFVAAGEAPYPAP